MYAYVYGYVCIFVCVLYVHVYVHVYEYNYVCVCVVRVRERARACIPLAAHLQTLRHIHTRIRYHLNSCSLIQYCSVRVCLDKYDSTDNLFSILM